MKKAFHLKKIIVLKGILIEAAHTLATEYAARSSVDFKTFVLDGWGKHELFTSFGRIFNEKKPVSLEPAKASFNDGCQKVIFILDDVLDYNHVREFINSFSNKSTFKFVITTRNDGLIDKLFNYNLQDIAIDHIEEKDKHLVELCLKVLKRSDSSAWEALQILCFIKEDSIFGRLMEKDLKEATESLKSQSFIRLNKNNAILVHGMVSELTVNSIETKTCLEFFMFISQIKLDYMNVAKVVEKLLTFDETEFEKQSRSASFDKVNELLLNMIDVLNEFQ